jgi:hypothetical protein
MKSYMGSIVWVVELFAAVFNNAAHAILIRGSGDASNALRLETDHADCSIGFHGAREAFKKCQQPVNIRLTKSLTICAELAEQRAHHGKVVVCCGTRDRCSIGDRLRSSTEIAFGDQALAIGKLRICCSA